MRNRLVVILVLLLIVLVGCDNENEKPPTSIPTASPIPATQSVATPNVAATQAATVPAQVKFVQASAADMVDIYVNNRVAIARFRPGAYSTEAVDVPSGEVQVRVVPAGSAATAENTLLDQIITFEPRASVMLLLLGAADDLRLETFTEDLAPLGANQARVSVFQAGDPVAVQIGDTELTDESVLPAGNYPLVVAGETLPDTVNLRPQAVVTIVLTDEAAPILVESEATPQTQVRFVHASADTPAIRVLLDGEVIAEELAFRESTSEFIALESRRYALRIEQIDAPAEDALLVENTLALNPNTRVEVVLYDRFVRPRVGIFPIDTALLPPNAARLTVIHVLPETPLLSVSAPFVLNENPALNAPFGTAITPLLIEARPQAVSIQGGSLTETAALLYAKELDFVPGFAYTYIIAGRQADEAILLESEVGIDESLATTSLDTTPRLRIVNASDETITAQFGDQTLVENLAAESASDLIPLEILDRRNLEITTAEGDTLYSEEIQPPDSGSSSVFVLPDGVFIAGDLTDPLPGGQARVRFVNGVTRLDAVTLYWYSADGINRNDPYRLLNPLTYGNSAYAETLPGTFNLMIIDEAGEVLAEEEFAVTGNLPYDVIVLNERNNFKVITLPIAVD